MLGSLVTPNASVVLFITQLVVLLIAGRLAGELMQRLGQPQVMGQIIAGVLLGPSVLGSLAPGVWHSLFPASPTQKAMLDAVAQLGIVLLLLMTGMETDLGVFRDARRPALSISVSGIVVPFACGVVLGALLPEAMLPTPGRRTITALFLGTALAISSVKIVALVVRDLGFMRRTVGQVIIAAAILDDTIGWLIVAVILGLAIRGTINVAAIMGTVLGTVVFLVASFTVGRRIVFTILRWSIDDLRSEMATVTTILVIAALMALLTNAIGVSVVLGAFIAGVLIGQSPLLTQRLDAQLRGLIVGLFMPVFFAVVGLSADLGTLAKREFLVLTGGLIVLASVGKFLGAFVGGRIGGLSYAESFAVGCGMNARGSTEIIVASIGLSMAALNERLFTAIVAMAVVTTMVMPPTLRWALRRLPLTAEERARIEREELEARGFLGQVERLLVAVDASPSGQFASRLAGLLAGVRRIPTTVLHLDHESAALSESEQAIAAEARKGYGLLLIGREPTAAGASFDPQIARSAVRFDGPFAIALARGIHRGETDAALSILVPVSGTRVSHQGAEVAIALAQASGGSVTALYVATGRSFIMPWRQRFDSALGPRNTAEAAIHEIIELAGGYGISVTGRIRTAGTRRAGVLQEIQAGQHNLLVMGVSARSGGQLYFGEAPAEILERAPCSVLFVSADPATVTGRSAGAAGNTAQA